MSEQPPFTPQQPMTRPGYRPLRRPGLRCRSTGSSPAPALLAAAVLAAVGSFPTMAHQAVADEGS